MARYDYLCGTRGCGHRCEIILSVKTDPQARQKCPECGRKSMVRVIDGQSLAGVNLATAKIAYQNRFPYVSNAFPFGGKGARHVGPRKKLLVESAKHEEKLRDLHGMVGEKGVTHGSKSFENDKPPVEPATANFYG